MGDNGFIFMTFDTCVTGRPNWGGEVEVQDTQIWVWEV